MMLLSMVLGGMMLGGMMFGGMMFCPMMFRTVMLGTVMFSLMVFCFLMLSFVVLSFVMLSLVMLSLMMLSLVMLSLMMLSLMMLSLVMLSLVMLSLMSSLRLRGFARVTFVLRELLVVVVDGVVVMSFLLGCLPTMRLVVVPCLLSCRFPVDSTGSVKTGPVIHLYPRMVNVGIVNTGAHMPGGGIIKEMAALPMPTPKTGSVITKSIVNSAVESNVRSPITAMPKVTSITPTPPPWSPKEPYGRRQYPHTGDPVIIVIPPAPIAGAPQVSIPRAGRLVVDRDWGRRDCNRDVR
jgi:hypothetical protein